MFGILMSKGPGRLQRIAIDTVADGTSLVTPAWLAWKAAEIPGDTWPTESQIRAARTALQSLADKGLITDHGFGGGTGRKYYGGPNAKRYQDQKSYAAAMASFGESRVAG